MSDHNRNSPKPGKSLDELIQLKTKIEEVIANQPKRKAELAGQLSRVTAQIDALQGQRLLF